MSTIVEDPGIPLVGRNGGFAMYGQQTTGSTLEVPKMAKPGRFDNVGYRLAKRKELFKRRKIVCDFALGFAVVGILLMILETELFINEVYRSKSSTASLLLKLCITISTVTLLGFVLWYHILDVKLFMCDNSVEDWRLAMSRTRILKVIIELMVYAIHPIPGNYDFVWRFKNSHVGTVKEVSVPVDVIFSIPMFLRLYLCCRVIMLHSKLFTDASSQSLGALNRINFNFKFIFKSMMTLYPEYVLTVLMVSGFIIASWAIRACEMYHDEVHANFFNSMWLIAITFLSVGYGDIVPNSYCGRGIAVLTGIFGAGCTALVVAVLARKLELSRAEKYVHNFVIDVELDKRFKVAAANILKAGWFVYKNKKKGKTATVRKYQRKLLKAIHQIRDVKQEQRRLVDSSVTLVEMAKQQQHLFDSIDRINSIYVESREQQNAIEEKLHVLGDKVESLITAVSSREARRQ